MTKYADDNISVHVIRTLGEKAVNMEAIESKTKIIALSLGLPLDYVQKTLFELEINKNEK